MSTDPTIEVVHAAVGFTTAAVHGDHEAGHELARAGLRLDAARFVDAVLTTIAAIADEAEEFGADIAALLRDLALGIHLAALEEEHPADRSPGPPTF